MMEHPHLIPKLEAALQCLYGNSNTANNNAAAAHEFLMHYKSSNVRRLVASRIQSQKDQGQKIIDEDVNTGSVFLSSLALLLQGTNINNRIFASQTINHRCRSLKLVETLDIEAEDGIECGVLRLVMAWEEIRLERQQQQGDNTALVDEKSNTIFTSWIERYVPMLINRCKLAPNNHTSFCNGAELLGLVLERHSSSLLPNNASKDRDKQQEEKIKGTLIMLTIAVAMYTSAFSEYEEEHQHHHQQQQQQKRTPWVNAVLCELGSALSITALRNRYKPLQDKYATPDPEPSCLPLIDMLVETIQLVKESAEICFAQKIEQQNLDHTAQSAIQQAHQHATKRSICGVIKSLPETVLLPPGEDSGHRVPSIDRASLRAASMELRSVENGMEKAWKVLVELDHGSNELQQDLSVIQLLQCCEAWARYTAVPIPIIESTVGSLAVRYIKSCDCTQHSKQKAQSAAFQYLISIFESASPSLTTNDVLTAALGVGAGNAGRSASKKKQSSKSKKRQDKRLGRAIAVTENNQNDGDSASAAEKELLDRRNAACVAAAYIFGVSLTDGSIQEDGLRIAATSELTSTHGICSTVASAATSVLPHLLFLDRSDGGSHHNWRIVLFSTITTIIRRICSISSRDIRALAYEPLMIFHTALNSVSVVTLQIEQVAVDEVVSCTLSLAASCGYPQGYFDCLSEDNEEELEIERNDIRDVARSVCSLDSSDISMNSPSILILQRIVSACDTAIQEAIASDHLPNETVVHILSALAKPLNKLGKIYKQQPSDIGSDILLMALQSIGNVEEQLNKSFDTRSISELLPSSRLVLMGAASLSPLLSHLVEAMSSSSPVAGDTEKNLFMTLQRTISSSLQHAMLSTARIPELIAESTLKSTRYDIRGAMRGPGGEDHVGCIALLRMSNESDMLARAIFEIYPTILQDLCNLHQALKELELRRGVNIDYGDGVCPVSRRMIIKVISHLSLIKMKQSNQSGEVQAILQQLLQAPLIELRSQASASQSAEQLFRVCEASFDLSYFSPKLVADVFSNNSEDLTTIFQCLLAGYACLSFSADIDETCHQWARLRGGAYCVMSTSIKESLTDFCANNISALIKAECEAATLQCNQGADSASNMFIDSVIGEEMVDAGVYLMLIRDCLTRISKKKVPEETDVIESIRCLSVLKSVVPVIVPLLMHQSPEANNHVDPRPTIAEAFYLTLTSLVSVCRKHEQTSSCLMNEGVEQLFGESLCLVSMLILLKDLGDKKSSAPDIQLGLSLDAAHTLAMTSFISESLLLGSSILSAGQDISSVIQLTDTFGQSSDILTAAILVASLLRAVSGALPPWSVEETPELFESIFTSICGSSADSFVELLSLACKLRSAITFGGVREGELLAGRYLDVSDSHISSFISQSKEVCGKGNWKKIKVILKSTCGGKKKDSGFNLKPGFTSWEKCDRL